MFATVTFDLTTPANYDAVYTLMVRDGWNRNDSTGKRLPTTALVKGSSNGRTASDLVEEVRAYIERAGQRPTRVLAVVGSSALNWVDPSQRD